MFSWDQTIRKYRDEEGAIIPDSKIRSWIDQMTASLALIFIARAERLRNEFTNENFVLWNAITRNDLTALHYSMMMIAFGGRDQMNADSWSIAEAAIAVQIGFWDNFAAQTVTAAIEINGNFVVRSSLYALAGYSTYQKGITERERLAGLTEERRKTTSGNPCIDCRTEEAKGWVALGSLRAIGDSVCLVRCRCYKEFR